MINIVVAYNESRDAFVADAPDLGGSPPIGIGRTPAEALGMWFGEYNLTQAQSGLTVTWPDAAEALKIINKQTKEQQAQAIDSAVEIVLDVTKRLSLKRLKKELKK